MRSSTHCAVHFIILGFLSFSVIAKGDDSVNAEVEEEIFHSFEVYREDIVSDRSHLGKYFSKEINEMWLKWLLEEVDSESLLTTQLAIKNRASFGLRVKKVYDYRVYPGKDGVMVLSIIYKDVPGESYYTYEIGYVMRLDRWLIRWVKSDITKPGIRYSGKVIREFSSP